MVHISLFCGIGGNSIGADRAGIPTVFATDIDEYCCHIMRSNYPKCTIIQADIKLLDRSSFQQVFPARMRVEQMRMAKASRVNGQGCSGRLTGWWGNYDPNTCFWKTSQTSLFGDGSKSLQPLPKEGCLFGTELFRLKRLGIPSRAKGFMLLHLARPLASDWKRYGFSMNTLKTTFQKKPNRTTSYAEKLAYFYDLKITQGFTLSLMGFPITWLRSAATIPETQLSQTWRKLSSKPSKNSTKK